jgi:hypothetical protein
MLHGPVLDRFGHQLHGAATHYQWNVDTFAGRLAPAATSVASALPVKPAPQRKAVGIR